MTSSRILSGDGDGGRRGRRERGESSEGSDTGVRLDELRHDTWLAFTLFYQIRTVPTYRGQWMAHLTLIRFHARHLRFVGPIQKQITSLPQSMETYSSFP